ncbi:MAG: acyl-CoA dehydrogenase family protein [Gammaproteobacteria bacterium]|nr:acyl-CoA dehydrogenase family protein [Gammaproteobacteria bacterium]MDH3372958.1 acyl-CoA dehydrogenase family protein [Gammaproteobacteria bacterium]MDH3410043.1 acyl-CoA dehydrogenase family protein [Gammaproteobacteria bacterium]MDH3553465.1 acyl-CoA dehydrogenase family protein [Gammaproteobacteria bacterium]
MDRNIFDEEHEMFRDSARRFFINEVQPHADRWAEQEIVDREAFLKAGENGLLCMWADEKYGGAGISDFRYEQILIEENARYGDVGFFMFLHSRLVGPYIGALGTEEQKARWLPKCVSGENVLAIAMTEPGVGSDLSGIRTKAQDKGDYYLLNGSKTFISNGILADLVIVAARTDPNSGHGLSLFVVERGMEGFERGRNLKKMGMHSQDTAELFFNNVKVPKQNLLGELNRGFYHLMHFLAEERLLSAVGSLATSEAAFAVTLEYANERQVFGRKIADFQVNRFKFADMRTEMDVCQAFIDRCVMVHNEGKLSAEDAAKAKLYATELEDRVTDHCVQLHGGNGYMDEYPVSRMYTAARVSRIYAGSSEIMREIIARSIGLDPRQRQKKSQQNAA